MGVDIDINQILELALKEQASDVHLKVGIPVHYRIKGKLEPLDMPALEKEDIEKIIRSILDSEKQVILKNKGDVDSSFKLKDKSGLVRSRYRVNTFYDDNGPAVALRVIPDRIMPVEKIGFPYGDLVWASIVYKLHQGLVLITGPTNSGKTTTIASLIQRINETRAENIVTLEDPIEYAFHPKKSIISQREVGYNVESFERGLESAMRQDPNIILVGEIRNTETARIALRAAQTGHLVFSTRHSGNSVETITQFASLFDPKEEEYVRNALSASLAYVISQRLIPYSEGNSRTLLMEVMNVKDSPAIKAHIRERKDHLIPTALQTGQKLGMITMDQHIKMLYSEGKIPWEDAFSYVSDPKSLS